MTSPESMFEEIKRLGETAIRAFVERRASETFFLEFKRSSAHGAPAEKRQEQLLKDRAHLSRAISGFGNSEGGVVLWGVDCSKAPPDDVECARALVPLNDPEHFRAWLQDESSWMTEPPHSGVVHAVIRDGSSGPGFVATLIPAHINSPLMVRDGRSLPDQHRFLIRTVNGFVAAPYGVLAGMFGRQPAPAIEVGIDASGIAWNDHRVSAFNLDFMLRNRGRVFAPHPFLTVRIQQFHAEIQPHPLGPPGHFVSHGEYRDRESGRWCATVSAGANYELPPGAAKLAQVLRFSTVPDPACDLRIEMTFGCNGIPPQSREVVLSVKALRMLHDSVIRGDEAQKDVKVREVIRDILWTDGE